MWISFRKKKKVGLKFFFLLLWPACSQVTCGQKVRKATGGHSLSKTSGVRGKEHAIVLIIGEKFSEELQGRYSPSSFENTV